MRSLNKFSSTLIVSVDYVEISKFSCSLSMKIKHLKISCQKLKPGSLLLSSRCMPTYMKTGSYLHAHFTETMKVVKTLLKTYGENHIS